MNRRYSSSMHNLHDRRHNNNNNNNNNNNSNSNTNNNNNNLSSSSSSALLDVSLGGLDRDCSNLIMRDNCSSRPLWVTASGHIFLETFNQFYDAAYDFLIAIAEPICRPELIHEYKITKYSLYAAASVGLQTNDLIDGLKKLSKNIIDAQLINFIKEKTRKCGKLRIILKHARYFLESQDKNVLNYLMNTNNNIYKSIVKTKDFKYDSSGFIRDITNVDDDNKLEIDDLLNKKKDKDDNDIDLFNTMNDDDNKIDSYAFEIAEAMIEQVKFATHQLQYPCVEEYDFRGDNSNLSLSISLKAIAKHRPYQEKCLSKMFGNGRARSGLIVLPCGAGKTLVGVTAIATIKKSAIIFANTTVSVHQWCQQILHWVKINRYDVIEFSSQNKKSLPSSDKPCILVTTYYMLGHQGRRSKEAQIVMDNIQSREWGLLVLDEVHVAPANTFRKCTSMIKSKCKLGLTATLLREDDKIGDLFYLIGPKLYEANWLDLQKNGYLACVQCIEVWCQMTDEFYNEYLDKEANNKRYSQILSDFNPNKFRSMQYLIRIHESRGDKVLVFSDNIPLLKHCAKLLRKPFIYGKTGDQERKYWLHNFNHTSTINCLFISSVGDTSIDLPDVNVVIQISSHYGSRRQEAQRLGRILRPKPRQGNEFNAFFYTLVSKDTVDMVYATKRQRFLVDQGYSFHVITNLVNDNTPNLKYNTQQEKSDLLLQVLTLIKSSNVNLQEEISKQLQSDLDVNRSSHNNINMLSGGPVNGLGYTERSLSSSTGLLSNKFNKRKRGVKRKPTSKFLQKAAKQRKTFKERKRKYLPH